MSSRRVERERLRELYESEYSIRTRFEQDIVRIIKNIITSAGYPILLMDTRTKEVDNFIAKANRPGKNGAKFKYKNPLSEITDITGVRIIVQFKDVAREIADILRNNLVVDEKNSRDSILESHPTHFSYPAIHIVASLSDKLVSENHCEFIKDWKFEIQIRTVLEHAWAELSRQYFYNNSALNASQRELACLAAEIERIDSDFIKLRNCVRPITKQNDLTHNNTPKILTSEIINFISNSSTVSEIRRQLANNGLSIHESSRKEFAEEIGNIFHRQRLPTLDAVKAEINTNIKKYIDACILYMSATKTKSYATDSLLAAAFAIVNNGSLSAEEYTKGWHDQWRDGFIAADQQFRDKYPK